MPSLTMGANEDFKDRCEQLIEKAEVDKELQLTLVLSLQEARLPSHCGKRGFFFLMEGIVCRGLN